jgi:hypothetical protein
MLPIDEQDAKTTPAKKSGTLKTSEPGANDYYVILFHGI